LPGVLRVNIFDFPGWTIFVDGEEVDYDLGEDLPIIELPLTPPNVGKEVLVSGRLMETPIRQWSNWLSIFSLIIISGIMINSNAKKKLVT